MAGKLNIFPSNKSTILGLEPLFVSDVLPQPRSVVRRSYVKWTKRIDRKWTVNGHCACNQWNVIESSFDVAKNLVPNLVPRVLSPLIAPPAMHGRGGTLSTRLPG